MHFSPFNQCKMRRRGQRLKRRRTCWQQVRDEDQQCSASLEVASGGSTIGLAGCGIWLIFVAIFGMGAENRSGKREFQLRAGAGFCVFKGSGCENRKGEVAGYGISFFTRLHDPTSIG